MRKKSKNKPVVWTFEALSLFPRKGKISVHFNEMRELVVDGNTLYYRNNETDIVITSIRPRRTQDKEPK